MSVVTPNDVRSGDARFHARGAWLIAITSAIALLFSLIVYFIPHGAIADSWGALLVVCSTALMLIASLLLAKAAMPHWLIVLFEVLVILDIAGTAVAAYFLEAYLLLVFMAAALVGWFVHLASDQPRISGN